MAHKTEVVELDREDVEQAITEWLDRKYHKNPANGKWAVMMIDSEGAKATRVA